MITFFTPDPEELGFLRADPLIWEQELDVRPDVAEDIERATGKRAGRVYWRSAHDHLYALELADLGRGRPSMATVYGFWDRWEPRPPEHEITADLVEFSLWVAEVARNINPADVAQVFRFANPAKTWAEGAVLRTPEERFANLPGYEYEPGYIEIEGLRVAYVEAGAGDPILMLHGEPTWGYLYRKLIPPLQGAGRVIVPDLVGFGRSDKPVADNAYSYRSHVRWLRKLVEALELERITLVCQDWGGLIGLRVVAQTPERFARLVVMNTGVPDGSDPGEAFLRWRRSAQQARELRVGAMLSCAAGGALDPAEAAAYDAPFPDASYQTGALVFPRLVPTHPDDPGAYDNRRAREALHRLDLPVLTIYGTADAITGPWEADTRSLFRNIAPPVHVNAGHFLQETNGAEIAGIIRHWIAGQ